MSSKTLTAVTTEDIETRLKQWRQRIDQQLDAAIPQTEPSHLHAAMRYTALGPGKRLRPLLCYAVGSMLGTPLEILDKPAVAIELIHAYSLVHDDLPAMDDDDLRRGRPTCHKAYDEATAILVGDALQSLAFNILCTSDSRISPKQQLKWVKSLSIASGSLGMCGGQSIDLQSENNTAVTLEDIKTLHRLKTGALIAVSVDLAAICSETEPNVRENLQKWIKSIGLAFQIQDDILDIEASTEILGKTQGKDAANHKATYPGIAGLDAAHKSVEALYAEAMGYLDNLEYDTTTLKALSNKMLRRNY